ncbi:MAG: helix-turn-helix domain-containing protein [Eubacterium sp.]|jgi:excisionase family DNA binding protein|nr:helix-turn-helix domain-containing protein [Eubacterium sp.]MBR1762307.1 helix-turn-helix domain-containing protein [Eubacterium sp.]
MFKNFDELPISLSVVQAAEVLGVSDVSLYHLIKTDKTFPVINIGRRMTVPKEQLKEWIETNCRRQ